MYVDAIFGHHSRTHVPTFCTAYMESKLVPNGSKASESVSCGLVYGIGLQ